MNTIDGVDLVGNELTGAIVPRMAMPSDRKTLREVFNSEAARKLSWPQLC